MKTNILTTGCALGAWLLTSAAAWAQHGHLNAGAAGHDQNDRLLWANGNAFAHSSGYVQSMPLSVNPASRYFGYFNSGPTFTALSSTNGGSAPGSFLKAEVVSVQGPSGGQFAYWESPDLGGGSTPTFSIPTGSSGVSYLFDVSDAAAGAGQPGQDSFGHLHGRRFTATMEGLYTVGFRVIDASTHGAGGGPIHTASEVLFMNFGAVVPEPSTVALGLVGTGLAGVVMWRKRRSLQRRP